jgi:internalin A
MKVCKHPLGTLAFFLFVSSFPAQATSLQEIATPKTFADWCLNKANLSVETKRTVDALLQQAETTNCHQANKLLSRRTSLDLLDNQISYLRPLSTLTNLALLSLFNNKIADLRPLSTLTNLRQLQLSNNQTLVDKTCPVKPASICTFVPGQVEKK